jgi:3-deoxy-7-phosphoheptulonate synthase
MLIILKKGADEREVARLLENIKQSGYTYARANEGGADMIELEGAPSYFQLDFFRSFAPVKKVVTSFEYREKVYRAGGKKDTSVTVKGRSIGGGNIELIAGPCSVESYEQTERIAEKLSKMGVRLFRGGAYKPRTSPYSFQGLNENGLKILSRIAKKYGMAIVTELLDVRNIDAVCEHADIIQIGTRNANNYALLKEVGKLKKPVLLKRGISSTIKEFLLSAEYIMCQGNSEVILCERGIRTFESEAYRTSLDITAVSVVKEVSHLPIIVDPSHSAGAWNLVERLSLASIAAGADGIMVEVHDRPQEALSDAGQSLRPEKLKPLIKKAAEVAECFGKTFMGAGTGAALEEKPAEKSRKIKAKKE